MHQGVRPIGKVVVLSIRGYVSIYRRLCCTILYKIRCESRLAGRPTKTIKSGGKSRNAGQRNHWALDGVLNPLLNKIDLVPFTSKESNDYYKNINQSDPNSCSTIKSHSLSIGFKILDRSFWVGEGFQWVNSIPNWKRMFVQRLAKR